MRNILIIGLIVILIASVAIFRNVDKEELPYQVIINQGIINSGAGLYLDNTSTGKDETKDFASKYYYRGDAVNNYFFHQDLCFRIINIANNEMIKIMFVGKGTQDNCEKITYSYPNNSFSTEKNNKWNESDILKLFEKWENEKKIFDESFDYSIFSKADYFIGAADGNERANSQVQVLKDHVISEREETYQGVIGMITLSDYLKAMVGLQHSYATNQVPRPNYLFDESSFWTITADINADNRVFGITAAKIIGTNTGEDGPFKDNPNSLSRIIYADDQKYSIYPVFYLKDGLLIGGEGTKEIPFVIK